MPEIITLGETMGLIRSQSPGMLGSRTTMLAGMGGAESNVAIAAARLGHTAGWMGGLGNDEFGDLILRELKGEDVSPLVARFERPTGLMIKTSPRPNRQRVAYYRKGSAGSCLAKSDLPLAELAQTRVFHTTGITLAISPETREAATAAARYAHNQGATVSFDVNHRSSLWPAAEARQYYQELASNADIVFAGFEEATLLTGKDIRSSSDVPAQLRYMQDELGIAQPIIKEGSLGAWTLIDGKAIHTPAVLVDAVDSVGAGDGFVAGYLTARLEDATVPQAMDRAVSVGAFACLSFGDWEGYPTIDELAKLNERESVQR